MGKRGKTNKKACEWFIEPLDSATNSALAQQLSEDGCQQVLCQDNKYHNLWACSAQFVCFAMRSKIAMKLSFRIFNRFGNGHIRECKFFNKKRRRKKIPPQRPD